MKEYVIRFGDDGKMEQIKHHVGKLTHGYALHTHDFYELELALEGSGKNYINGRKTEVSAGSLWLVGPGDTHRVESANLKVAHISVQPERMPPAIGEILGELPIPGCGRLSEERFRELSAYFAEIPRCGGRFGGTRILGFALLILCGAGEVLEGSGSSCPSRGASVRRVMEWLGRHYTEPVTLREAAKANGFSPCYLSDLFRKSTGTGFSEYLSRLRLEEAKKLLAEGGESIQRVAEKSGFGSVSGMNRCFAKKLGMSPSAFRKSLGT